MILSKHATTYGTILALLLLSMHAHALGPSTIHPKDEEFKPVRSQRPITLSGGFLGKTPLLGATLDFDLFPHVGLGVGYGFFSLGGIAASFIPLYIQVYPLKSNFSPFLEGGADFITLKFDSTNVLLSSTFSGMQWIMGAGLEYRFDFGLMLRTDVIRYINAAIWAPGLNIGYSFGGI